MNGIATPEIGPKRFGTFEKRAPGLSISSNLSLPFALRDRVTRTARLSNQTSDCKRLTDELPVPMSGLADVLQSSEVHIFAWPGSSSHRRSANREAPRWWDCKTLCPGNASRVLWKVNWSPGSYVTPLGRKGSIFNDLQPMLIILVYATFEREYDETPSF